VETFGRALIAQLEEEADLKNVLGGRLKTKTKRVLVDDER